MKKTIVRRSTSFLIAAILIAAMSVSALACGIYYYVTYEVNEDVVIPTDVNSLIDQDADFEFSSYSYTEDNGTVTVDLSGMDLN